MPNYSAKRILKEQAELYAWLSSNGKASQSEICKGLGWPVSLCRDVIYSKPEWLVAAGSFRTQFGGYATLYDCQGEHVLGICPECKEKNFHPAFTARRCPRCSRGLDKLAKASVEPSSLDGSKPTNARAGSNEKIEMLIARFEQKLDLWNPEDNKRIESKPEFSCFQPGEEWNDDE